MVILSRGCAVQMRIQAKDLCILWRFERPRKRIELASESSDQQPDWANSNICAEAQSSIFTHQSSIPLNFSPSSPVPPLQSRLRRSAHMTTLSRNARIAGLLYLTLMTAPLRLV